MHRHLSLILNDMYRCYRLFQMSYVVHDRYKLAYNIAYARLEVVTAIGFSQLFFVYFLLLLFLGMFSFCLTAADLKKNFCSQMKLFPVKSKKWGKKKGKRTTKKYARLSGQTRDTFTWVRGTCRRND